MKLRISRPTRRSAPVGAVFVKSGILVPDGTDLTGQSVRSEGADVGFKGVDGKMVGQDQFDGAIGIAPYQNPSAYGIFCFVDGAFIGEQTARSP